MLGWVLAGSLAAAVVELSAIPGSGLVALLFSLIGLVGALTGAEAADRRTHAARAARQRPPRAVDPRQVPPPDPAGLRRLRARRRLDLLTPLLFVAAIVAVTPWMSANEGALDSGPASVFPWWAIAAGGTVAMLWEARDQWRAVRRLRGLEASTLPRGLVTVLGFTGSFGSKVVVTSDVGPAYAMELRRRLDAVPGDVLVCDGVLEPGGVVALSGPNGTVWRDDLQIVPAEDLADEPADVA